MSFETLRNVDTSRWDEPDPKSDLREFLEAWLDYQRHEFIRKLRDLDRTQLVTWSIPPVELSVLGLVRHMTQMEHNWLTWGLGGGDRVFRYGEDDYAGASIATIDDDLSWLFEEIATANAAVAEMSSLEECWNGSRSLASGDACEDDRRVRTACWAGPHASFRCARRHDPLARAIPSHIHVKSEYQQRTRTGTATTASARFSYPESGIPQV